MSDIVDGLLAGDRRALARAITLVESSRADHREQALDVLDSVLPRTGGAARVGVSGPPGVGKSMFIEALGLQLIGDGHRVAVLAVDPSSRRSGGSILGDKTRMAELARDPAAFIRPSPSRGDLGGVARRTGEVLLLCEAAGFDVVLVETVGVGQSEVAVADLVDTFVLLVASGGGDELQGIKRGIMELADVVVVTKADGDLVAAAARAEADHRLAVQLLRRRHPEWPRRVVTSSARTGAGIREAWDAVVEHRAVLEADGSLAELRAQQAAGAYRAELEAGLVALLRARATSAGRLERIERDVRRGATAPGRGAWLALEEWRREAPPRRPNDG